MSAFNTEVQKVSVVCGSVMRGREINGAVTIENYPHSADLQLSAEAARDIAAIALKDALQTLKKMFEE